MIEESTEIAEIRAAASVLIERMQWMRQHGITFHGMRDLYEILGYSRVLTNREYRARYHRGGIAGRIVDAFPNATWRGSMELIEDEDPKVSTTFEEAWIELDKRLQIQAKLHRVDKLAGLSTYAVLLIGAPGNFNTELPKGKPQQLLYLTPFSGGGGPGGSTESRSVALDAECTIQEFDTDTSSPRFGLPISYQLQRYEMANSTFQQSVHWTRIIHIAEGCLSDDVYGQPALERVWNLIDDLEKVTGGGAEAFWLRANQGLHLNVDKDMSLKDATNAVDQLKEQAEQYQHQMTRWLRTRGVDVEVLGSEVANFTGPVDAILTQIAGAKGIPKRILSGSELGELASSQDRDNWKDQVNGRQTSYAGPYIVRPLVDRLIKYGYLPTPSKGEGAYEVRWPHIQTLTEQEKAEGAQKWAEVNKTAGVTVFTANEIRDKWYGMQPADEGDSEKYKAEGAQTMAQVNKAQGLTVFTPAEIRKTWYGWKPLSPKEMVPIAAPERISGKVPGQEKLVNSEEPELVAAESELSSLLEDAIKSNDIKLIDRIIGTRHLLETERKFSSTQVQLPSNIANEIFAIGRLIPDEDLSEDGRETDAHVTVKYGLHTNDASVVRAVLEKTKPITLTLGETAFFHSDEHDVLYVKVESTDLVQLNKLISESLDVTDTHPIYQPHATIAYLKSGLGEKYEGQTALVGQIVTIDAILFSPVSGDTTIISLS